MEQSVYALLRTRDMAIARYKDFSVPTQWMLDSGLVGKVFEVTSSYSKFILVYFAIQLLSQIVAKVLVQQ